MMLFYCRTVVCFDQLIGERSNQQLVKIHNRGYIMLSAYLPKMVQCYPSHYKLSSTSQNYMVRCYVIRIFMFNKTVSLFCTSLVEINLILL